MHAATATRRLGWMNLLLLLLHYTLFLFLGRETHAFQPPRTTSNRRINLIIIEQYRDNNNNIPLKLSSNDDNADDDGWGDENSSISGSSSLEEKAQKLRQLQRESSSQSQQRRSSRTDEPERDLFIPIFAIVSLLGLFGTYAYEMARLASKGELYLPWDN
jgi:hypothetical protein